jgi:hypothetical protein
MEDIIAIAGGILIILIPVAGITARIALAPLIDAVTRAMQARQGGEAVQLMERRMALLEQELQAMRHEVHQISEERDFHRRLSESAEAPRIGG